MQIEYMEFWLSFIHNVIFSGAQQRVRSKMLLAILSHRTHILALDSLR